MFIIIVFNFFILVIPFCSCTHSKHNISLMAACAHTFIEREVQNVTSGKRDITEKEFEKIFSDLLEKVVIQLLCMDCKTIIPYRITDFSRDTDGYLIVNWARILMAKNAIMVDFTHHFFKAGLLQTFFYEIFGCDEGSLDNKDLVKVNFYV